MRGGGGGGGAWGGGGGGGMSGGTALTERASFWFGLGWDVREMTWILLNTSRSQRLLFRTTPLFSSACFLLTA